MGSATSPGSAASAENEADEDLETENQRTKQRHIIDLTQDDDEADIDNASDAEPLPQLPPAPQQPDVPPIIDLTDDDNEPAPAESQLPLPSVARQQDIAGSPGAPFPALNQRFFTSFNDIVHDWWQATSPRLAWGRQESTFGVGQSFQLRPGPSASKEDEDVHDDTRSSLRRSVQDIATRLNSQLGSGLPAAPARAHQVVQSIEPHSRRAIPGAPTGPRHPCHRNVRPDHQGAPNGEEWDVEITDSLYLYTDGSFSHRARVGGAGVAYRINDTWHGRAVALGPIKGSYEAELLAVKQALLMVPALRAENRLLKSNIVISTDAIGIRDRMTADCPPKPGTESEIVQMTQHLRDSGVAVYWSWVKGHSKNSGNERADLLAGFGSQQSHMRHHWGRVFENPAGVDLAPRPSKARTSTRAQSAEATARERRYRKRVHRLEAQRADTPLAS